MVVNGNILIYRLFFPLNQRFRKNSRLLSLCRMADLRLAFILFLTCLV